MDILAERALELLEPGAPPRPVRVVVGRPERDGDDWITPVGIHGPGAETWEDRGHGTDSLQALFLALDLLATMLTHRFRGRGDLTIDGAPWDEGLGLREPPSASSMP